MIAGLWVALGCCALSRAADSERLRILFDAPSMAVFGGAELNVAARVIGNAGEQPLLVVWSASIQGRVLQRGEQMAVHGHVRIPIRLPEPDPGLSIPVVIKAEIPSDAATRAAAEMQVQVFSHVVFNGQTERLRALEMRLFDPVGETARRLEESGLPFVRMRGYDPPPDRGSVWIVGEGVSFADYRGLFDALVAHAKDGGFVLCLAPSGGSFDVPGLGGLSESWPTRLVLSGTEIVPQLDKRLDSPPWAGCASRPIAFAQGHGGRMMASVEGAGWHWIEAAYERGALYLCGLPLVACWEANPSAGYGFAKVLELIEKRRSP